MAIPTLPPPSAKAVEIARRACRIAEQMGVGRVVVVANRCADASDADRVAAATRYQATSPVISG